MSLGRISEVTNNLSSWITRSTTKQIGIVVYSTTELLMHRFPSVSTVAHLGTIHTRRSSMDMDMDIVQIRPAGHHWPSYKPPGLKDNGSKYNGIPQWIMALECYQEDTRKLSGMITQRITMFWDVMITPIPACQLATTHSLAMLERI